MQQKNRYEYKRICQRFPIGYDMTVCRYCSHQNEIGMIMETKINSILGCDILLVEILIMQLSCDLSAEKEHQDKYSVNCISIRPVSVACSHPSPGQP